MACLYIKERVVYGYLVLLTKMTKLFTTTVFWGVQPHGKGGWMDKWEWVDGWDWGNGWIDVNGWIGE